MKSRIINFIIVSSAGFGLAAGAFAQGTAFTYQGRLNASGAPANGKYDVAFTLYATNITGVPLAGSVTNSAVGVTNGLFTTVVDFGNVFTGTSNWLELAVSTNSANAFSTLVPRQQLTPVPYAVTAQTISGPLPLAQLPSAVVTNGASGVNVSGSFTGNGLAVTNVNAAALSGLSSSNFWQLGGNNVAPGNFLGSTNNQPVELRVNGARGLRLELNADSPNVVGGASNNIVGPGVQGATIAGGGSVATYGSAFPNRVDAFHDAIGGGLGNWIQTNAYEASIAGGNQNQIQSGAVRGFIGAGILNLVTSNATHGVIGGGLQNTIRASYATIGGGILNNANDPQGFIGGGTNNSIDSRVFQNGNFTGSGNSSVIGGGYGNLISYTTFINSYGGSYSTIGGGKLNKVYGDSGTIGGGTSNTVNAFFGNTAPTVAGGFGNYAENSGSVGGGTGNSASASGTVPGGLNNSATGGTSLAAGNRAKASNNGAFVWSDSQSADFSSTANDQFCIRAQGGIQLDNSTSQYFGNQTRQMLNLYGSTYGIGIQNQTEYFRTGSYFYWYAGGVHNDNVGNAGGGLTLMTLSTGGLTVNGTFVSSSDRNVKENFKDISAAQILAKVATLPISQWNYKQDKATAHIGPMAQDFYAAFAVGPDDKHIAVVDESGVALAAIQGLNQKLEEQQAENAELKARLAKLEQLMMEKLRGAK